MTTPVVYGLFLKSLVEGRVNFNVDSFKAMLCTEAYSPNQSGHQFKSSVIGEATGSGYAPGGLPLLIGATTYANRTLTVQANNLSWPMVTLKDVRYLVVYNDSFANDSAKPLVLWVDFLVKQSPTSKSLYYNWPNGELLKLQVP